MSGFPRASRSPLLRLLDFTATIGACIAGAGVLVRAVMRDASPVWAAVYYALPLILIALALLFAGLLWLAAGRRRMGTAAIAAGLLSMSVWIVDTRFSNPCSSSSDDVRVLLLNTARGRAGWDRVARSLPPFDVDIIGLVEAGSRGPERQKFWEQNFPEHNVYLPGGGLAIITRGDVRRIGLQPLDGISRMVDAEIDLEGRLVRVILVDLDASPRFDKRRLIAAVFRAAGATPDVPTIVMGDFNTPVDSRWFDRVRTRFRHVFETAGSGMLVTWPAAFPLVAIDHVWVSEGLAPTCAAIEAYGISDHKAVTAHLALSEEEDTEPAAAASDDVSG